MKITPIAAFLLQFGATISVANADFSGLRRPARYDDPATDQPAADAVVPGNATPDEFIAESARLVSIRGRALNGSVARKLQTDCGQAGKRAACVALVGCSWSGGRCVVDSSGPTTPSPTKSPTKSPTSPPTTPPTNLPTKSPSKAGVGYCSDDPGKECLATSECVCGSAGTSATLDFESDAIVHHQESHLSGAPSRRFRILKGSAEHTSNPNNLFSVHQYNHHRGLQLVCDPNAKRKNCRNGCLWIDGTCVAPATPVPTKEPTNSPSTSPTSMPTKSPTPCECIGAGPSPKSPNTSPGDSLAPSISSRPSFNPTKAPTGNPTAPPTGSPTNAPSTQTPSVSPTLEPTGNPTTPPTGSPTNAPSTQTPSVSPTMEPTRNPSTPPTGSPTNAPSTQTPSVSPTMEPTRNPSTPPTGSPTKGPSDVVTTYVPGDLTVSCDKTLEGGPNLTLSTGLACRLLSTRGQRIQFDNGAQSSVNMHTRPDGATVIPDYSDGGWFYMSNAERGNNNGLVGAFKFNSTGHLLDYQRYLQTNRNCGGGRTPWNTWISCEENTDAGNCHEVDPNTGFTQQVRVTDKGGNYESFAYDDQDTTAPGNTRYFVTEDSSDGALIRYTPTANAYTAESNYTILNTTGGTHEFLILVPDALDPDAGNFSWTADRADGESNAGQIFPNTEGIDCHNRILSFVSKNRQKLFTLDLRHGTYIRSSTVSGMFDMEPDQLGRIMGDGEVLYFAEDGDGTCDIHGRDSTKKYFTIVQGDDSQSETTGLAFSPDGKFFYAAFQTDANVFAFWRTDGLPFNGVVADTRYHTVR